MTPPKTKITAIPLVQVVKDVGKVILVDCECGNKNLTLTDKSTVCPNCGRTYHLTLILEVEKPKRKKQT